MYVCMLLLASERELYIAYEADSFHRTLIVARVNLRTYVFLHRHFPFILWPHVYLRVTTNIQSPIYEQLDLVNLGCDNSFVS